jgi:hypothetical protein
MQRVWCVEALADVRLRGGREDSERAEKKLVKLDKLGRGVGDAVGTRGKITREGAYILRLGARRWGRWEVREG